jgi:PII-like signaling protein
MLAPGLAKKITIHLNEDTSAEDDFLYRRVLRFLFERGVAGASLLRPEAGFGSREHLPVRIEFIESREKVESLLPELCALVTDGLIEAQDTLIIQAAGNRLPGAQPQAMEPKR